MVPNIGRKIKKHMKTFLFLEVMPETGLHALCRKKIIGKIAQKHFGQNP